MVERVAHRAVDLRDAAQRIRVLDLVLGAVMIPLEFAVAQQVTELGRDRHLAGMRARELVRGREGDVGAEERLDAHRRHDRCGPDEPVGVRQQERPDGAHQLCPVQQGQAFLRPELERFESDVAQGVPGRHDPSADLHLAAPDERQGEVGEGREIARGADTALRGHDRVDAVRQHRQEPVHDERTAAAVAERQRVRPQQEHRAHDLARERRPDTGRVAHQQPALEFARPIGVHESRRQVAETRRHAIDDRALRDQGFDDVAGLLHPFARVDVERDGRIAAGDRLDVGDRQIGPGEDHRRQGVGRYSVDPAARPAVRVEVRDLWFTHRSEDSRLSSAASLVSPP